MLGEVKWTNQPTDMDVVDNLLRKSKMINFTGEYKFLFISKNGFTDKAIARIKEINGIYLVLNDITKLFDGI